MEEKTRPVYLNMSPEYWIRNAIFALSSHRVYRECSPVLLAHYITVIKDAMSTNQEAPALMPLMRYTAGFFPGQSYHQPRIC